MRVARDERSRPASQRILEDCRIEEVMKREPIAMATSSATASATASVALTEKDQASNSYRHTYHEMANRHVIEVDVIEQLKSNMAQLEDMHARLSFMMSEIRYLLKKS